MSIAIKVENLSKIYRLGEIGTGTISHDLERWWKTKILKKEDPFLKIGETNDRTNKGKSDFVYSLKDINFEINQGDAVGIIGRNGAGKSTLLKVLSQVTSPTTGNVKVKGRIASLLEVGTGFHPELTGRENIYLNGAILGMRKAEIKRKFDEIVDFAGVERYIDTPVKRYSSGMYVRLAFAVAAHLESEILIVDEVLAVGDAEFQKKCLGKMGDISKGHGRTILFVSHSLTAVKELCNKGILLRNGTLNFQGSASGTVTEYQRGGETENFYKHEGNLETALGNELVRILKFTVNPSKGEVISISSGFFFELEFYCNFENRDLAFNIELRNAEEIIVFHQGHWISDDASIKKGIYTVKGNVPADFLNAGIYSFKFFLAENYQTVYFVHNHIISFEVNNEIFAKNVNALPGVTRPKINYEINYKENI